MKITVPNTLGSAVRDHRKKKQMTQSRLAEIVGVFQKDISKLENNPEKTNFGLVLQVCAVLEMDMYIESSIYGSSRSKNNTILDF